MAEVIYLRLCFAIALGLLLAALASVFVPRENCLFRFMNSKADRLIWIAWGLGALFWWGLGIFKYMSLRNSVADLALYANTLWLTLHGNILGTAISSGTYLNFHFSPSFVILALIYAPWQSPIWLIGMQDICATSGALALYLLVKKLGGGRVSALLFGCLWLASYSLRGAVLYDFHEVTMVSGLFMWLAFLVVSERWVWALALALFLLGIKEDMPIYLASLGLILAWSFGKARWGWGLIGLSILYYFVIQTFVWNAIAPDHLDFIGIRFPVLASPDGNTMTHILNNPLLVINFLSGEYTIWASLIFLLPFIFLPFLRWGGLALLLPLWMILNIDLLSFYLYGTYHYICPTALFFIAAIPGWFFLRARWKSGARLVNWLLLSFGLVLNLAQPQALLFSQLNPSAYVSHPAFAQIQRIADATPTQVSVTADRMTGSPFSNRFFLDNFPSVVVTDRLFLSNTSLHYPEMILALGGLGYKGIEANRYLWTLSRDGTVDVRESFMERLRWMEAEDCDLLSWKMTRDRRATDGQAVFLPADAYWGDRAVLTQKLLLPPGDYRYDLRIRATHKPLDQPFFIVEVHTISSSGNDEKLEGYVFDVDPKFRGMDYKTASCPFTQREWGFTYLNINFGNKGDFWWDGISLEGLPDDFNSYFSRVFPKELNAYEACTNSNLIVAQQDSYAGKVVEVSSLIAGEEFLRWDIGDQLPEGDYRLYYVAQSPDKLKKITPWAIVELLSREDGTEYREDVGSLIMSLDYLGSGEKHLEWVGIRLRRDSTLIFRAMDRLEKKIYLDKLWITPVILTTE